MWRQTLIGTLSGVAAVIALTLTDLRRTSPARDPLVVRMDYVPEPDHRPAPSTRPFDASAALDVKISEIDFNDMPLDDVINYLREITGTNFIVEWGRIEFFGIPRDTRIQLSLRNVTARTVLDAVCAQLGYNDRYFGYVLQDNIVRITAGDDAHSRFVNTRIYPIRDWVEREVARSVARHPPTAKRTPNLGGGNYSPPDPAIDQFTPAEREVAVYTDLIHLIRESIDRDSWVDNGGRIGSVRPILGRLVITQSPKAHQQIEELLAKLRAEP